MSSFQKFLIPELMSFQIVLDSLLNPVFLLVIVIKHYHFHLMTGHNITTMPRLAQFPKIGIVTLEANVSI